MLPLGLSAHAGNWRVFTARKAEPAFLAFAEKIYTRDNYICQFCGFQAKEFQEIINLDQNYHNNKVSNLVTACIFCTQCFFLDTVGVGDFGGGVLIYLPEIAQTQLNSFCHVLFCAVTNDTGYKNSAQAIYRSLKFRSQSVEEQFGEGLSTPSVFGQMLIENKYDDAKIASLVRDIRLLPSRGRFKVQIERWASAALSEMSS